MKECAMQSQANIDLLFKDDKLTVKIGDCPLAEVKNISIIYLQIYNC